MNGLTQYAPLLLSGAGMTLFAWFCAGLLSLAVGILLGIVGCQHNASRLVSVLIGSYTFVTKGVPAYVQILIAYFVVPALLGLKVSGLVAATLALACCSSGYVTEIIRAGINALPQGQWDACFMLGYSRTQAFARIILPQAMKVSLPALLGELEQLLKSTSLLAAIGVTELTRSGMNIISRELNPIPVYGMLAVSYLIFSGILTLVITYIQQRRSYGCGA